jgi:hypothetical protein
VSRFNRTHDNRICSNHGAIPDTVWPQNLATRTQENVVTDLASQFVVKSHVGMKSSQTHPLKDHHITADPPCADDAAYRMSEK